MENGKARHGIRFLVPSSHPCRNFLEEKSSVEKRKDGSPQASKKGTEMNLIFSKYTRKISIDKKSATHLNSIAIFSMHYPPNLKFYVFHIRNGRRF